MFNSFKFYYDDKQFLLFKYLSSFIAILTQTVMLFLKLVHWKPLY